MGKDEFRAKWSAWLAAHTTMAVTMILFFVCCTVFFGIETVINTNNGDVRRTLFLRCYQ